jgi:two-component system sensor histidine kinase FlrB
MTAEIAARVFEPFFTTRSDGTGLGLAVVQAVVRAHQGDITLHSRPGAGTSFVLRLPLAGGTREAA